MRLCLLEIPLSELRVLTDDADLPSALSGTQHFTKGFYTLPRFNPHTDPQGFLLPVLSHMSQLKLRDGKGLAQSNQDWLPGPAPARHSAGSQGGLGPEKGLSEPCQTEE